MKNLVLEDDEVKLLAQLIAGLQVPRSIGGLLGAAIEPYDALRSRFRCFGWQTAEEVEKCLRWDGKGVGAVLAQLDDNQEAK
jgi:hypothetical protein